MTIFDRKKQVVSDSYIFKGVMQGAGEGMEDYLKIYPKP
jgi:endoglucanase